MLRTTLPLGVFGRRARLRTIRTVSQDRKSECHAGNDRYDREHDKPAIGGEGACPQIRFIRSSTTRMMTMIPIKPTPR